MFMRRLLPWLGVLLFLGGFFFYPLGRIMALSLDPAALTYQSIKLALDSLVFTFYQALLSTILTLLVGVPAAVVFARFEFPGKKLLRLLTAIPFMLPTVVVAAGFSAWLGPRGWANVLLQKWLQLESPPILFMGTLAAILVAHVFYNTTIIIRMVSTALNRVDPRLEQTAASLGANPRRIFRYVTLPLLKPALLAGSLMVFIFDFTSFGVILLLGGVRFSTLEVEIYNQALNLFNLPLAAWLSVIQLLCTLVFSIFYSRMMSRQPVPMDPRLNPAIHVKSWKQRIFVGSLAALLFVFYAFPLLSLPFRSVFRMETDRGGRAEVEYGMTLDYYKELFINRRASIFYVPPGAALGNSMGYAALTVILSLCLGYPAATALARPGRLERVLDPILFLPLGASSVTLGLGFILAFGRLLAYPWMVPIAHTLVALPFVIRTLQPTLASIPDRLKQAAATLGASPSRIRWQVEWPIMRRAVLSAMVFAFTISLGEFGATLLLSRPEYPTLPVAIYRFLSQPGGMNYGQAMAMATILMLAAGAGILWIEKLRLPGTADL